jgi:predicted NAD/FAD-dependent oxidoreductase
LRIPCLSPAAGSAGHISGIEQAATSLAQLAASVAAATPQPCFALMLAWRQPLPGVPFDSASFDVGNSSSADGSSGSRGAAFQWIACDSSKPGRPQAAQCWVALTSPQRTQQLLENYPLVVDGKFQPQTEQLRAAVAAELLSDFTALMQPFVEVRECSTYANRAKGAPPGAAEAQTVAPG